MATTRYRVYGCTSLNVRKSPSSSAKIICTLDKGDTVRVVDGYSKTVGDTTWLKIKSNENYYYVSSKYVRKLINYQSRVATYADKIYAQIISLGCIHKYGALTLEQMKSKKMVTCATSESIVLQEAGILPEGKILGHTDKASSESSKDTIAKCFTGVDNLKKGTYTIHKVGKKYSDMSSSLKEKGTVYVWNSNIGINAGGNYIYSCNNASSELKDGKYIKNKVSGGYCFNTNILYAITFEKEY